jgi:hypothetical protein
MIVLVILGILAAIAAHIISKWYLSEPEGSFDACHELTKIVEQHGIDAAGQAARAYREIMNDDQP